MDYASEYIVDGVLTLNAGWSDSDYKFYVGFDDTEGVVDYVEVTYGQCVRPPSTPSISSDLTFMGWYADPEYSTKFDFTQPITKPTFVYAKWDEMYAVFFDSDGGEGIMGKKYISRIDGGQLPPCSFIKEKCLFVGWKLGDRILEDEAIIYAPLTDDDQVTLTAVWHEAYVIHFDGNGATSGSMDDIIIDRNLGGTLPKCTFEKTGIIFFGWETHTTPAMHFNDEATITEPLTDFQSITFYAIWGTCEAIIGSQKYPHLEDALYAAVSGDTVMLMKDISRDVTDSSSPCFNIGENIVFDGGSHTISINASAGECVVMLVNGSQ